MIKKTRFSFILILAYSFVPATLTESSHHHHIDDFSRLNSTKVTALLSPSSYKEVSSIVDRARKNGMKISIMGSRHSQGGHAFYPNALAISLKNLNKVTYFDPHNKLITVQAGATWKEIQEYLNPHGLALQVMQFANLFTVGGSLSVNCNGVDPNHGPLIESVQSIKVLSADGKIVHASRSTNQELFHLAIGGYGLFGIILEATLEVEENSLYKRETKLLSLPAYVNFVTTLSGHPDLGFHFAFFNIHPLGRSLFSNVTVFNFFRIDPRTLSSKQRQEKQKLYYEKFVALKKWGPKFLAKSKLLKAIQWIPEAAKHGRVISRNNIMRPPASHFYVELKGETNLLQEYFIPVNNLPSFIKSLEYSTKKLQVNLMHVALRFIPHNTESFLSYTKTDCIGIVLFFNQKMNPEGNNKTRRWTRHLIDTAIHLNGRYYLPIQLHATKNQLQQAYPDINTFFKMKKQYDPQELFINHFYKKYSS